MFKRVIILMHMLTSIPLAAAANDLTSVMLSKSCINCNFANGQFPLANLSNTDLRFVDFSVIKGFWIMLNARSSLGFFRDFFCNGGKTSKY